MVTVPVAQRGQGAAKAGQLATLKANGDLLRVTRPLPGIQVSATLGAHKGPGHAKSLQTPHVVEGGDAIQKLVSVSPVAKPKEEDP